MIGGVLLSPLTLLERTRGRKRIALAFVYLLILMVLAVLAWRALSLRELPDIGEPVDPSEFAVRVPEDRNAFTLYKQASAVYRDTSRDEYRVDPSAWKVTDWSQADPVVRRWVEDNREALGLWLRGSERDEAQLFDPHTVTFMTILTPINDLRAFERMAVLEASRRMGEGDVAGAWELYRGVLRASRHAGMRGSTIQRLIGMAMVRQVMPAVEVWLADPRVDAALLRRALDDVKAVEAMTPPNSEAVKVEYLMVRNELMMPERFGETTRSIRSHSTKPLDHFPGAARAYLWLKREPERGLRLLRLLFASWLSHCDKPPARRAKMVTLKSGYGFYPPAPDAPRAVRAFGPDDFESWFASTADFIANYSPSISQIQGALDGDRQRLGTLKLGLAVALYEREHGGPPKKLEALVGPYLEQLPEGYRGMDGPERVDEAKAAGKR